MDRFRYELYDRDGRVLAWITHDAAHQMARQMARQNPKEVADQDPQDTQEQAQAEDCDPGPLYEMLIVARPLTEEELAALAQDPQGQVQTPPVED